MSATTAETPAPADRDRVTVVATGGTIASQRDAAGRAVAALDVGALLRDLADPRLAGIEVHGVEVCRANGWNVSPADALEAARAVTAAIGAGATGVVVTHGTDTLEDTAFLLELLCGHLTASAAVVVTGAMRAADEVGADGPRNLADAVVIAASPAARRRGVLVALHDDIHLARRVTKERTLGLRPFGSAGGTIGSMVRGAPAFTEPPRRRPVPFAGLFGDVRLDAGAGVGAVLAATGDDGAAVDAYVARGAAGLVVVGTGAGNVPGALVPSLQRAIDAGTVVVVTSRAAGPTAPVYGGPGGNASLLDVGVVDGAGLRPGQARLTLMVALAAGLDLDQIRSLFSSLSPFTPGLPG